MQGRSPLSQVTHPEQLLLESSLEQTPCILCHGAATSLFSVRNARVQGEGEGEAEATQGARAAQTGQGNTTEEG